MRGSFFFDGFDIFIGSDGVFVFGRLDFILDIIGGFDFEFIWVVFFFGIGGGCVERGLFNDMVVRFGFFFFDGMFWINEMVYGNNFRCLDRDLNMNFF